MKKLWFFIMSIVLIITASSLTAEKIATIDDLFKSPQVYADGKGFYIYDPSLKKLTIYDKKTCQKVSDCGRFGQGPGEFTVIGGVYLVENNIYLYTHPKICIYNYKGQFIREIKGSFYSGSYAPLGKNFIGQTSPFTTPEDPYSKIIFSIFDSNFKEKKDFFLVNYKNHTMGGGREKHVVTMYPDCVDAVVYKNRLYIGDTGRGFYFAVFDEKGSMLYEIKRDFEKRKITGEDKKHFFEGFQKVSWWKNIKNKPKYTFNDYFPAYENFYVTDDRVYVSLFFSKDGYDVLVLDLKGNLMKKLRVTSPDIIELGYLPLKSIYDGKCYYMKESPDDETWELHGLDLDKLEIPQGE